MIAVDTSALIAVLYDEVDASNFKSVLVREDLIMSAANYMEAGMVVSHTTVEPGPLNRLEALIKTCRITIAPVGEADAQIAIAAYRDYGKGRHRAKLNYGDCFAYALAISRDIPLLFKGNDFIHTDVRRVPTWV